MARDARPDAAAAPSERSLRYAWLAMTTAVALCLAFAALHLLQGGIAIANASRPRMEVADNPLIPPDLDDLNTNISRYELVQGRYSLGVGAMLALVSMFAWTFRGRILPGVAQAETTRLAERFQRYALYGMAAACVGVIASPYVHGAIVISPVLTKAVSQSLMLVGFGASTVALAIAWDARLRIADVIFSYAMAVCGTLLSSVALAWMFVPMLRRLW